MLSACWKYRTEDGEGARLSVEALVGWGFLNSTRAFGVVFFFLGARRYIRGLFFIHRKLFY
ncbi:hypothetical protein ALO78_102721 [Pseudomonas amygdali pv. ciccaronei]|nr:hypothetical protein ALO78_102721 [Pseudomonas amygdali pv. ciccaronei]